MKNDETLVLIPKESSLADIIGQLDNAIENGAVCKREAIKELIRRQGHRSFGTNLEDTQDHIYQNWRSYCLELLKNRNIPRYIATKFYNTEDSLLNKLPIQVTERIVASVEKTYDDTLKSLEEVVIALKEETPSHNTNYEKASLGLTGKFLKINYKKTHYILKRYRNMTSNNYVVCKKLLNEQQPFTLNQLNQYLDRNSTALKDLPSTMGFEGTSRDIFIDHDTSNKTLSIRKSVNLSESENKQLSEYVKKLER